MATNETLQFETGRIKALQEERLAIQKKTFTKWMNSFLAKAGMELEDLFEDLADGKKLLKLLEIISGEKLPKPSTGKMRVHRIENVNKALAFLHTKVRLESIGAEDIVDGNPRLTLGLIWTIILRFQIQEIEIKVDEESESSEKKSAKEALLLWCQRRTAGYPHVHIQDFSGSWRSGMAFNALIHSHRPDLIDYNSLNPRNHIENLNHAFDVASRDLGVPRLLDAEDIDCARPDEKSVMTYVSSYYHVFAKLKNEMKGGRRIANILQQLMEMDRLQNHYETLTTDLLTWIQNKIAQLDDRNFPNSLEGIQKELIKFKDYRTIEKPVKFKERSEIEALLFLCQTKAKSLNQPPYQPPEGCLVQDIERMWSLLEKAEHKRETALREELLRLQKLENLANRFERKAILREGYLKEMISILFDPRYGSNLAQVEATVKKHEAISADILARNERFQDLENMARQLIQGNYHRADVIKQRVEDINRQWKLLLDKIEEHQINLTEAAALVGQWRRDCCELEDWIEEKMKKLISEDIQSLDVPSAEEQLSKHRELKGDIDSRADKLKQLIERGQIIRNISPHVAQEVDQRVGQLNINYGQLVETWKYRNILYEENVDAQRFRRDAELLETWLDSREGMVFDGNLGDSIEEVEQLIKKHAEFEKIIFAQEERFTVLQRLTLVEKKFQILQQREQALRKEELMRRESQRIEELKKIEERRMIEEYQRNTADGRRSGDLNDANYGNSIMRKMENFVLPKAINIRRAEVNKVAPPKPVPNNNSTRPKSLQGTNGTTNDSSPSSPPSSPPSLDIEGILERKQELVPGGKKAPNRSWKQLYTVLIGQLMCFFKDREAFMERQAAAPPVNITGAKCSRAADYTKRKNVFRLQLSDGSAYLFYANDEQILQDWLNKVTYHANSGHWYNSHIVQGY